MRVGIIGLKSYDHLKGVEVPRYLGGIETQLAVLAKGLVTSGCEVSVVTFDHEQEDGEVLDGVNVIKSHKPKAGIPFLRTLHPRSSGIWRAIREADADVYLQMGAGIETAQTALSCRTMGRPFVFCLASDANFGAHLNAGPLGLEGKAYAHGLRGAQKRISQTTAQREGLLEATGLDSTIIPMAVVPRVGGEVSKDGVQSHVLWVGRITKGKRLEWLVESARHFPDVVFDIVGAPNHESQYANDVLEEARSLPNMKVHGRAPASTLSRLYEEADLLCCTSELEGFPTTFLEAWSGGVPVVTTFDPDGVVAANELGSVARDLDEFIGKLNEILNDDLGRKSCGAKAREYFEENHSVQGVCNRFRDVFEMLVKA